MASNGSKYPQLHDREWLERRYATEGRSTTQIASELGCDSASVAYHLRQFDIPIRGRWAEQWQDRECETCGALFTPSGPRSRFCSPKCRGHVHTCERCGNEFRAEVARRFCTKECLYAWRVEDTLAHPISPRGERKGDPTYHARVNDDGYVEINVGRERSGRSDGRMLMHRYVMEEHLSRRLGKDELVHHKHGDRQDNRIEQLELCVKAQPPGQRVTDLIAWARAILARYAAEESLL